MKVMAWMKTTFVGALSIGVQFSSVVAQDTSQNPTATASTPRERQIELPLRAAPAEVSSKATVYILGPKGYEKAREGAMPTAPPKDSSTHDKLAVWAGHWKTRIETKETQFRHASTEYFDEKCSFFPNHIFLFCDYLSLQVNAESNGGVVDDVSLVYYSDVDKTFKYTNVAPEGGPDENTMQVDGKVWTRPFEFARRSGGVVRAREIYDFVSPDKILARLEMSTDNGEHWTLVHEAVSTREP
jgi:hypothetical protein